MARRACCGLIIADGMAPMASVFPMRNIWVRGHRTSIRLEPQIWDMLAEICRREFCTTEDVCTYVDGRGRGSLASLLRVFILDYFRTSATEEGHRTAGHGQGMFIAQQRERLEMRASKADCRETREGSNHDPRQARSGPGPAG